MHDTMPSELAKQRRHELTPETEQDRLIRTVRGPHKRWGSGLVWELKRAADRLRKSLQHPKSSRG